MIQELERLNDKWNSAWLNKDSDTVEGLLAEDYEYIGPQGQVLDRSAILEIIRSPSYHLSIGSWEEVTISQLSLDSVLVLDRFRGEGEYRGQAFKEDHRHTTVWVRRSGQWFVRLEHCSAIGGG